MRKILSIFIVALFCIGFLFSAEHVVYDSDEPGENAYKNIAMNPANRSYFEIGFSSGAYDFKGVPSVSFDENGLMPLVYDEATYIAEGDINIYWLYGTTSSFDIVLSCTALVSQSDNSVTIPLYADYGDLTAESGSDPIDILNIKSSGEYQISNSLESDTAIHLRSGILLDKPAGEYRGSVILEVRSAT